jgi:hypothetical protein
VRRVLVLAERARATLGLLDVRIVGTDVAAGALGGARIARECAATARRAVQLAGLIGVFARLTRRARLLMRDDSLRAGRAEEAERRTG